MTPPFPDIDAATAITAYVLLILLGYWSTRRFGQQR